MHFCPVATLPFKYTHHPLAVHVEEGGGKKEEEEKENNNNSDPSKESRLQLKVRVELYSVGPNHLSIPIQPAGKRRRRRRRKLKVEMEKYIYLHESD